MTPPAQQQKTAVIVGATGNLGRALSTALTSAGWHIDPVWTSDNRPDAAKAESYASLPARIDFAAYLAGVNVIADTQDLAEADWDRVFATNLRGAFLFAKAAFPGLCAAGKSSYVAISTINTLHPYPRRAAYAASKAGLEGLVRELAVEWGAHGIATHAIRLGHLAGLMKTTPANPALLAAVKEIEHPASFIAAAKVAKYLVWVAEGGAQSISGSIIDFDPAYTINRWPL
jgi:NAD(P)-dependent dehydrogenase (short-subunit alcohol dehydrogenase family)